jgi:hypothetical protein
MVLHFDNFSGFSVQATKDAGTTSLSPILAYVAFSAVFNL